MEFFIGIFTVIFLFVWATVGEKLVAETTYKFVGILGFVLPLLFLLARCSQ
jgi:hypothetical protein